MNQIIIQLYLTNLESFHLSLLEYKSILSLKFLKSPLINKVDSPDFLYLINFKVFSHPSHTLTSFYIHLLSPTTCIREPLRCVMFLAIIIQQIEDLKKKIVLNYQIVTFKPLYYCKNCYKNKFCSKLTKH